ncbi:MAG: hypothetical protein ACKVZ0_17105 [Gemmatimonadales bacterium]
MKPTALQHLAAWTPLIPAVLVAFGDRWRSPPRRWMALWCGVYVALNALAWALAARGVNNHWLGYLSYPGEAALAIAALAACHGAGVERLALRFTIPLLLGVTVVVTLILENPRSFSLIVGPLNSLVVLLASVWTAVRLGVGAVEPLHRQDWFWLAGGIMLFAAGDVAWGPVAWYLSSQHVDLLHSAINTKAAVDTLAFGALTVGILCPTPAIPFGGSSSPGSLRSSSW